MIMRVVITITAAAACLAVSGLAEAATEAGQHRSAAAAAAAEVTESNVQQQQQNAVDEGIDINVTAVAARLVKDYVTPALCSYSPGFCAQHQLQSRGIQSYLATAGTLFAGALGVLMSKITLLIVLSVMSTVIGKLLLLYALFKAGSHHHPHHHDYKSLHHHAQPYVKYTKDKYFIKNTPSVHSHDVIVDSPPESVSPYHAHSPSYLESTVHDHKLKGVSYYKRR